jgi:hypothetical protein
MSPETSHPIPSGILTRRDFIKLGFASLGLFLPLRKLTRRLLPWSMPSAFSPYEALEHTLAAQTIPPDQQGRVLDAYINVYDAPTFQGQRVNTYWRDQVIPITNVTIGSEEESHNRVWYRIGEEGYAHSGMIQPVRTLPNQPVTRLPETGALAEVTVPFTDARQEPGRNNRVAYRYYYGTTHWITDIIHLPEEAWYQVLDDKWEFVYYVPASHLHVYSAEELAPISPDVPPSLKRLEVHIPDQLLIAYEFDEPVFVTRVATGAVFSNGDFSTPLGRFITFHKRGSRHMAAGNLAANGYDLPGVPWNSYITEEGIAFHGTYWHNNFGRPRSHGCINMTIQAARWLYHWSMPSVSPSAQYAYERFGTAVDIIG